jgi:TfoX/Sxy family transcriptional regulator of competence genes
VTRTGTGTGVSTFDAPHDDEETIRVVHDVDLAERVRARLADEGEIREVSMFGGLSFMVDGKMAVAVRPDGELLLRVDPDHADELLGRPGAFPARMGADRVMSKGWLSVSGDATTTDDQLLEWLEAALRFTRKNARS